MVHGGTISKPTGSNKTVFVITKNDPYVVSFMYISLAVVFILLVVSGVELSMI